jgi:predicted nucleotidyltransferase
MFTPEDRNQLRAALIAVARADARITSAALTGSAAVDAEDTWSDIDLALSVADDVDYHQVIADWTEHMYREYDAVHHLDVFRGTTLFRVFLLPNTLQVDLAFWPAAEFGAIAPTFRLLFGTANELPISPAPSTSMLIGMAWLYALHARSSIARHRVWQAEYMLSAMRDQVLALVCLRHGVPAVQGRGIDRLPPDATAALRTALVRSLDLAELLRAFGVVSEALIDEIQHVEAPLASRLAALVRELASDLPR